MNNAGGFFFPLVSSGEGQEPAFSFLATLASSSSEEIESQLQERVESSRRAVSQVVTVYDKLQEKVELLSRKLNSGGEARAGTQGAEGEEQELTFVCSFVLYKLAYLLLIKFLGMLISAISSNVTMLVLMAC